MREDGSELHPGSQIYNIQKGLAAREAGLASQSTTHYRKGEPMSGIRAVVVDLEAPNRLALADVGEPSPTPSEVLVRVSAVSLNRGEVRRAESSEPGFRPGWDLAGTVESAAADGSGPQEGSWTELGEIAARLLERGYTGKAVLRVSGA